MESSGEKKKQARYHDFKDEDFLFDMVNRCQNGDAEAMESVYTAYKVPILNLAYRFTGDPSLAEDLLQDIFVKIFVNIKGLRSPGAFKSWLYRIAVNTCMSFARKKGKKREVPLEEADNISNTQNGQGEVRQQLEKAIKILPPGQRIVFQLHDVQGFTHTEIANIMKCSEGTAKSQLFKARMKIRNLIKGT